jgi:hypothetical protein
VASKERPTRKSYILPNHTTKEISRLSSNTRVSDSGNKANIENDGSLEKGCFLEDN